MEVNREEQLSHMSGHSKWANIKHKKEANDSKRSGIFSKMSRLITSAVHEGGGFPDPDKNFKLRIVVDRAKEFNMPKDTIQRAIDKAVGDDAASYSELVYEGFGPGGVALMIAATTDNGNRTFSEVKQVMDKSGYKLGSLNSVAYMFQKCGVVELPKDGFEEKMAFSFFDEIEGIDLEDIEDTYIVYVPFENIGRVEEVLGKRPKSLDIYYYPLTTIALSESDDDKLQLLIEKLEDLDDVHNVYDNRE